MIELPVIERNRLSITLSPSSSKVLIHISMELFSSMVSYMELTGCPCIFSIRGGWLSITVTICVDVFILPCISFTVQVTAVLPAGNIAGASLFTELTPQLSLVTGVPNITPDAVCRPRSELTVISGGAVMDGSWLSETMTVKQQLS